MASNSSDHGSSSTRLGALSRLKRNKNSNESSTVSLVSNTSSDDKPGTTDKLLSSVDRTIERVRSRRSVDERNGNTDERSNRLSSILPGRSSRRGSKQKGAAGEFDFNRRSSLQPGEGISPGNQSDHSHGQHGSSRSSLLSEEYSEDERKPNRPTVSPHDSHSDLLTLSSPSLHTHANPQLPATKVNTVELNPLAAQSAPVIPDIIEPTRTSSDSATSLPEVKPTSSQSTSKSILGFGNKASDDSAVNRSSVGGGIVALFKPGGRRGSINRAETPAIEKEVKAAAEIAAAEALGADRSSGVGTRPETPTDSKKPLRINSTSVPSTPVSQIDAPKTFVTPPTPTENSFSVNNSPTKASPTPRGLSSVESIRNRRAQASNSPVPSKLSNYIAASPLTPTAEELKTPGGTLTSPANANGGFFTSFLTAAQKAATQLTDNINIGNNPASQKGRTASAPVGISRKEEEVTPAAVENPAVEGEKRELAVETLGEGSLSLSHLGISDITSNGGMSSTVEAAAQPGTVANEDSKKAEEDAAARAVSAAYEQPVERTIRQATGSRPLSVASAEYLGTNEDVTPPRTADADTPGAMRRQGSVRSRISGRRKRHRGSSATTATAGGNSIAAGLSSSMGGLVNPGAAGAGHRLTGFAVASSKRNKDFHALFRSVPEDDYLIEDYSAALQRDILLHGRLYVSEGHICFSSNILGWVTNLVISFDEVVSVEKKNTAVIFPNALVISTLQARNTFASFVARDSTYELLIGIWKINHPNLKSSLNGVTLDNAGTGDKTEKAESVSSDDASDSGSDEIYDEDEDETDIMSFTEADGGRSIAGSDVGDMALSRKTSHIPISAVPQPNGTVAKASDAVESAAPGAAPSTDYPGPQAHAPTECTDTAEHYDRPLTDTTIAAPLGKIYSLMFGPSSSTFMKKWLVDDQKSRELDYPDDKTGLDNSHKTITFTYIKPLNAPVGPRQTKCITTNTLESFDLEKAVSISCSTQTPDVPSGNVFTTKTRYCLMWGPGNSTRIIANCTIEWTGKSWLKGPIEKGAQDGQTQYVKDITTALRAAVASRSPAIKGVAVRRGKRKSRKEVSDPTEVQAERTGSIAADNKTSWGLLEPVRPLLEPFVDILRPLFPSTQAITIILLLLLLLQWWRAPTRAGAGVGLPGYSTPERLATYEEIWRREESELWDWLEDRVGLDGVLGSSHFPSHGDTERQKVLAAKEMGKKLSSSQGTVGGKMKDRQVDDAIRITEERLSALKDAVARKKGKGKT